MEYKDMDAGSQGEMGMNPLTPVAPVHHETNNSMEQRLRVLGAKIDQFMARAEAAKERAGERAVRLRDRKNAAMNRFNEFRTNGNEAWQEFKPGLGRAWDDLRKAWVELRDASNRAAAKLH